MGLAECLRLDGAAQRLEVHQSSGGCASMRSRQDDTVMHRRSGAVALHSGGWLLGFLVALFTGEGAVHGQQKPLSPCKTDQGSAMTLEAKPADHLTPRTAKPVFFIVPAAGCRIELKIDDKWALPAKTASF